MGFKWQTSPEQAFVPGFDAYALAIHNGIHQIALRRQPEIEAWMKANAKWTDRTGNARQSLHADVEAVLGKMVEVSMDYGVDYGVWLALAHAGKYDIIAPAMDYWGQVLWNDIRELLS